MLAIVSVSIECVLFLWSFKKNSGRRPVPTFAQRFGDVKAVFGGRALDLSFLDGHKMAAVAPAITSPFQGGGKAENARDKPVKTTARQGTCAAANAMIGA